MIKKRPITGLTQLRRALNYSADEFANEFGVSRATVWRWERELSREMNRKICLKFGIVPEIDLREPLSQSQEDMVYKCAWSYLMKDRDNGDGESGEKSTFREQVVNSTDYVLAIDRTLAEVKDAFLKRTLSENPCIRIMTDALEMRMDEWLEARRKYNH